MVFYLITKAQGEEILCNKKIVDGLKKIKLGKQSKLILGNLECQKGLGPCERLCWSNG